MQVTIFQADCLHQSANCNYPHKMVVTSEADMAKVQSRDHVCAEYENGYRSKDSFVVSDNLPMDCDNDHSDDPDDWITPVTTAPVATATNLFAENIRRMERIRSPATRCRPSLIIFIPKIKIARPPST